MIEAAKANGAKHIPSITQGPTQRNSNSNSNRKEDGPIVTDVSVTKDELWLMQLEINPAYNLTDVRREYAKMQAWCSVNRKMPTRRRFVAWLNRVEKPMDAPKGIRTHESTIDRS